MMRSISSALAVSRMTGMVVVARRKPASDKPSSPGIMMSSRTRSIAWTARISRAAAASAAVVPRLLDHDLGDHRALLDRMPVAMERLGHDGAGGAGDRDGGSHGSDDGFFHLGSPFGFAVNGDWEKMSPACRTRFAGGRANC